MRVARSFSSFEPRGRPAWAAVRTALRTAHAATLARLFCVLLSLLGLPYSSNSARMRFSLGPACYVKFMDGQIQSCGVRMVQNFIG
jgi:hypothetical protein